MITPETVESGFDIWTGILCSGGVIGIIYSLKEFVRMISKSDQNSSSGNTFGDYSDFNGRDSSFKSKQRPRIDPHLKEKAKNVKYDQSRRN